MFAVLALTAGAAVAQSADCIDVNALPADPNGGRTIDRPGNYCLSASIGVSGGGNGINIASGGVVLDLRGFSVFGGPSASVGIYALDRNEVTVRNGSVFQFQHGLVFATSSPPLYGWGNVVEDMRFTANGTSGINVSGVGALVRRNVIQSAGVAAPDSWAIGLLGSHHRVMDNDIIKPLKTSSSGVARGIWVNQCRDVMLFNNRITQADWGILFDAATGLIRDNATFHVSVPYLNLGGYGSTDAGNNH